MPPLLQKFLNEILTKSLAVAFAIMVERGWVDGDNATLYITGAVGFILTVGWGLWMKYKDRLSYLSAKFQTNPTGEDVKAGAKTDMVKANAFAKNTDGIVMDTPPPTQKEK